MTKLMANGIEINEHQYSIEPILCSDLKFLLLGMGLTGANEDYFCPFCYCSKKELKINSAKKWSIDRQWDKTNNQGNKCVEVCGQIAANKNYGHIRKPLQLLRKLCIKNNIVVDTLHLFLRISDVLLVNFFGDIVLQYRGKQTLLVTALTTIEDICYQKVNIKLRFRQDACKLAWTALEGEEREKLHELFPTYMKHHQLLEDHNRLGKIITLWEDFNTIMKLLRSDHYMGPNEIEQFHNRTKLWVSHFVTLYTTDALTPYIHILHHHIHELLELHQGNIHRYTCEGLEKKNDQNKNDYYKCVAVGGGKVGPEAILKSLAEKQNRQLFYQKK